MSLITTITPVWGRPEMLRGWLKAIRGASIPEVKHFIYFVGEKPPEWWSIEVGDLPIVTFVRYEDSGLSIGHYHNLGIEATSSEWVMKLDVDTIPNMRFFKELLPVLKGLGERQWLNVGMFYINQAATEAYLNDARLPLGELPFLELSQSPRAFGAMSYPYPSATNFVCRKKDYLDMGGCLEGFRGYGWEDYQQIYGLEFQARGRCPLLTNVTLENVTSLCRDGISRTKARMLHSHNKWLALLHRWHPVSSNSQYRSQEIMRANQKLLFDFVVSLRAKSQPARK